MKNKMEIEKPTPLAQQIIAGLRSRGYVPTKLGNETQLAKAKFVFIVQNCGTVLSMVKKERQVACY